MSGISGAVRTKTVKPNGDRGGFGRPFYLERFEVGAFRGLHSIRLDSLARINLVIGRNDSGKTSILEALAMFSAPLDMFEWANIARSREVRSVPSVGDTLSAIDSIRWMFPNNPQPLVDNMEEHRPICLSGHGAVSWRSLDATCQRLRGIPPAADRGRRFIGKPRQNEGDDLIEDEGWLIKVKSGPADHVAPSLFPTAPVSLEFPLWSSLGLHYLPDARRSETHVEYLAPYAHRAETRTLRGLSSAVVGDWKVDIEKLLGVLDPDIVALEIVSTADGKRPAIVVRHLRSGTVPISVLGDGVRRALSIALSIRRARNGLLLIDEIEAALHVSTLDRLFPWVVAACVEHNVQIVATTHSLEAIDAIGRLSTGEVEREVAAYHLPHGSDERAPKRYSGGMLHRLVHQQGLDVR